MSEPTMWLDGDEDGSIRVVCSRPECMSPGPVTFYNPDGLYQNPEPIKYRPNPDDVAAAWAEHEARHGP